MDESRIYPKLSKEELDKQWNELLESIRYKTIRTEKELLQLLLGYISYIMNYNSVDDYNSYGLCSATYDLFLGRLIDRDEFGTIIDYIKENRPNNLRTIANSITILHIPYYWKKGKMKPRIKWLKKHINKLS